MDGQPPDVALPTTIAPFGADRSGVCDTLSYMDDVRLGLDPSRPPAPVFSLTVFGDDRNEIMAAARRQARAVFGKQVTLVLDVRQGPVELEDATGSGKVYRARVSLEILDYRPFPFDPAAEDGYLVP